MKKEFFTRADRWLIGVLLAVSLAGIPAAAAWARAQADPGRFRIDSPSVTQFTSAGGRQHLRLRGPLGVTMAEIRNGRARVVSSPCPNQLCVRRGWTDGSGRPLVCAPNRVLITPPGDSGRSGSGGGETVDAVSR